jgi:hypothetical protein
LSDIDITKLSSAEDCLRFTLKRADKLECIKRFENYILEEKPILTLEDCDRLLTKNSKLKCFDKVYFYL